MNGAPSGTAAWSLPRGSGDEGHGGRNGSSPARAAGTPETLRGLDMAMADAHAVELAITFADDAGGEGAGTTRAISAEEVRFTTARAPDVGRRIDGSVRFPPGPDGVAAELRYEARVTDVAAAGGDGVFEVRARFEHLAFAARRVPG